MPSMVTPQRSRGFETVSELTSASSASEPPSPRLSARIMIATYLIETSSITVQNISDSTPITLWALTTSGWCPPKVSLMAYSGLVPMSP